MHGNSKGEVRGRSIRRNNSKKYEKKESGHEGEKSQTMLTSAEDLTIDLSEVTNWKYL